MIKKIKLTLNNAPWRGGLPRERRHLNSGATTSYIPTDPLSDYPIFYSNHNDSSYQDKDFIKKKKIIRLPRMVRIINTMMPAIEDETSFPVISPAVFVDQGYDYMLGLGPYLENYYQEKDIFIRQFPFGTTDSEYLNNTAPFVDNDSIIGGDCLNFVLYNISNSYYNKQWNQVYYRLWDDGWVTGFQIFQQQDQVSYPTNNFLENYNRIKMCFKRFRKYKTVLCRSPLSIPDLPPNIRWRTNGHPLPPYNEFQTPEHFYIAYPAYKEMREAADQEMDQMVNGLGSYGDKALNVLGFEIMEISQNESFQTFANIADDFFNS